MNTILDKRYFTVQNGLKVGCGAAIIATTTLWHWAERGEEAKFLLLYADYLLGYIWWSLYMAQAFTYAGEEKRNGRIHQHGLLMNLNTLIIFILKPGAAFLIGRAMWLMTV